MQPFLWPSKFKRITTNVKFHLDGFFSAYTSEFKIESLFLHVHEMWVCPHWNISLKVSQIRLWSCRNTIKSKNRLWISVLHQPWRTKVVLKKLNMENVKEKMSTAWEVTKEQVKNVWRFKCWQDEYSWSVKYLGCSCRRFGEGDGLGREGASCRSVRRILQSSEGFGGERAHHHGEDQDEDLWDLGGHQGAGLKQLKLPATKLNVHELSNY